MRSLKSSIDLFKELAIKKLEDKKRLKCYKEDFTLWAKERLGITVWSKQAEIAHALIHHGKVAVKSCHGSGKAQPLDTIIPTPDGYTTMGAITPGDYVLDEQGKPTLVTAISPVWNELDTYAVTFDDGTTVKVNGAHEWSVQDLSTRKRGVKDWREEWDSAVTYETQELLELGLKTSANQWRFRVPTTKPLQLPYKELPIDPYVFGVWLGDGTSVYPNVTSYDDEIINRIAETENIKKLKGAGLYALTGKHDKGLFKHRLKALGVLGDKRIPVEYLRASEEQRLELLRGIMDADGTVDENGSTSIDWTKKDLAEDLVELITSLGWKVSFRESDTKIYGRTVSKRYRMNFRANKKPFHLQRKANLWKAPKAQASRYTQRTIVAIDKIDSVPTKCITVDSANSLYLTGREMVPTHNSFLASLIIAWWVDTRGHENGICVSTAPSADQVGKVVWRYVRQHHAAAKDEAGNNLLPGYVTQDNDWKSDSGELRAFGRKPSDHSEGTFQGIHAAGGVLAVIDEANSVADSLWTDVHAITTGENDRILAIANPDIASGEFFDIFHKDNPDWHKITISAYDTPNFTGEDVPSEMRPGLIQPKWVEERKRAWGEDDPRWKSKILAEFSLDSSNMLFGMDTINKGIATEIVPRHDDEIYLGVDIARFGEDSSAVFSNHGGVVRFVDSWRKTDTVESAQKIHEIAVRLGASQVRIDGVGIGAGVVDQLTRLSEGSYYVISFIGNGKSPNILKWYNARAYWFDKVREDMRLGLIDIAHDDQALVDDLTAYGYSFPQGKAMLIEAKDDLKKRIGRSPDLADAFIYATAPLATNVESPLAKVRPGEVLEFDLTDMLYEYEKNISPF